MTIEKIHTIDQGLFDHRGVCYWACEFMSTATSGGAVGPWFEWNKKDYATLRKNAADFTNYVACFNWAKAKKSETQAAQNLYADVRPLATKRMYRICLYIGPSPKEPGQNHEIMCITGTGTQLILFDPNFGFYEIDATVPGVPTVITNRAALEYYLATSLYRTEKTPNFTVSDFVYRDMGAIK